MTTPNGAPMGADPVSEMLQTGERSDPAREVVQEVDRDLVGDAVNAVGNKAGEIRLFTDSLLSGPPNDFLLVVDRADDEKPKTDAQPGIGVMSA